MKRPELHKTSRGAEISRRILVSVIALLGAAMPALSGEPSGLTLSQAIAEAKRGNPAYLEAVAHADETSWGRLEALAGQLPKVSLQGGHLLASHYAPFTVNLGFATVTTSIPLPETTAGYSVGWTLFDGMRTWNNVASASRREDSARLMVRRRGEELVAAVRLAFYRTLAGEMLLEAIRRNIEALEEHAVNARKLLKVGRITRVDTLRIDVELRQAIAEEAGAIGEIERVRLELAETMGLRGDERALAGKLPVPDPSKLPSETQRGDRADVAALKMTVEAEDRAVAATSSEWLPQVSANYTDLLTNYGASGNGYSNSYVVGVALTWNVFDGGASLARRRASVLRRQQAEIAAAGNENAAAVEEKSWRRAFVTETDLYRARKSAVELSEESLRLAVLGMKAGARTSSDVLDVERELARARSGLVRAQLAAAEALVKLELALGGRLK
jgi:outer membrane protein TolC